MGADGQAGEGQTPSTVFDLSCAQAVEIASLALLLFEALEGEPYEASYGLDYTLRCFRDRMVLAMTPLEKGVPA